MRHAAAQLVVVSSTKTINGAHRFVTSATSAATSASRSGPLVGIKVLEIAGVGPSPMCGMLLSDMGADVIRIDRPGAKQSLNSETLGYSNHVDFLNRNRRSITMDLKHPKAQALLYEMVTKADVFQEGSRPGVMERLGFGPDELLKRNPRLVYGRMTGWGQTGPLAQSAGHDINYVALSSALFHIGPNGGKPTIPLSIIGDTGAVFLAMGICAALVSRARTGEGQVIDASKLDAAASMMTMMLGYYCSGRWNLHRGTNGLDGGAPYYDTYETSDGKYVAVGSLEPKFYALLLRNIGLDADPVMLKQNDAKNWPQMKAKIATAFKQKTQREWCDLMEGTDICFSPVLSVTEAPHHPHNQARGTFLVQKDGTMMQPNAAPRFSKTPSAVHSPPPATVGMHTDEVLSEFGLSETTIKELRAARAI